MTKRAIDRPPNSLMSAILLGAAFLAVGLLAGCTQTAPPEPKTCGDLLSDAAVQQDFAQFWRGRLAEANSVESDEPPLGAEELDGTIDMFVMVTQGYCQVDASQPIPYFDEGEDKVAPTSARAALAEYVERLQGWE